METDLVNAILKRGYPKIGKTQEADASPPKKPLKEKKKKSKKAKKAPKLPETVEEGEELTEAMMERILDKVCVEQVCREAETEEEEEEVVVGGGRGGSPG